MTELRKQKYDIYINTPKTGVLCAANAVLLEENSHLKNFGFRYTKNYLNHANAFEFDPVQLPLKHDEFTLNCSAGIPGILDDYLPDDWGRKILTHLAFYRDQRKLNSHSSIDILSMLGNSRIGALQWRAPGEQPCYELGAPLDSLATAEAIAQKIDESNYDESNYKEESPDEVALLYLANAGTGVGGARPKALIQHKNKAYLSKFNRLSKDNYNNARVELACLQMAKAAGIHVYEGHVAKGREVLMLERFDISQNGKARHHIISVNSLLKNQDSQADIGSVFRYDDIASLIRKYSTCVENDLEQLLRVMLFNSAIHNTDDHERNFSFINDEAGFHLAPAYDMVPSLTLGEYHAAGFQYQPNPPKPSELKNLSRVFGLSKPKVKQIGEQVSQAISNWSDFASNCEVKAIEDEQIKRMIRI